MSFGDQLKKRREELGLSRSELADRLGVSRSAVGNYETGVSAPKEEVLLRLFDALHVEPKRKRNEPQCDIRPSLRKDTCEL